MSALIPLTLFGWIPVVLVLFSCLPARRAVIAAYLCAWLFLPVAGYELPGFTNYNKVTATTVGVLLGVCIFDFPALRRFQFRWIDVPMACFCLSPLLSSITNGLGVYDGFSGASYKVLTWGLPYFTGRLYFSDLKAIKDLAFFMVLGGIAYVPLCLWEVRMSPQLHNDLYGMAQHAFDQTRRGGGFRPMVFMDHGLMLSMWMAVCTLCATHLWLSKTMREIHGIPMSIICLLLFVTTVLCKSSGALLLLVAGLGSLIIMKRWRTSLPIVGLIALPVFYVVVRSTGWWDGTAALEAAALISEDRAGSLRFRFEAEDLLAAHALEQPLFGWGTWGRNFVPRFEGSDRMVVADGLWILTFGTQGFFGLFALLGALLAPVYGFLRRYPARRWGEANLAVPAAMSVVLCLYSVDNLVNAMVNPIYMLVAGSVAGVALAPDPAWKLKLALYLRHRYPALVHG